MSQRLERLQSNLNLNPAVRSAITAAVPKSELRRDLSALLESWEKNAPDSPLCALSWALQAASATDEYHRNRQSLELVWTGPNPSHLPFRRTDQVLLDLIESATESLLVVTFAAYNIPEISSAMLRAANRGVRILLVLESAEMSAGRIAQQELAGIEKAAAEMITVYVWPLAKRGRNDKGDYGSLHVKCAVADRSALLISSANLTEFALNLNMELGVLIRGGELPRQVTEHISELVKQSLLVPATQQPK